MWGLTLEEASGPGVDLWPDNVEAALLFISVATQWRVSASGVTGLDYNVLFSKMGRMGLTPERYDELEDEVRTMECAAMEMMRAEK